MEEQKNIDSWDGHTGSDFLKAGDKSVNFADYFVVVDVEYMKEEDRLRLHLEQKEEKKLFDLNVTNARTVKDSGIKTPKELIGKTIKFNKVMARNPKTNTEVESLRIWDVQ